MGKLGGKIYCAWSAKKAPSLSWGKGNDSLDHETNAVGLNEIYEWIEENEHLRTVFYENKIGFNAKIFNFLLDLSTISRVWFFSYKWWQFTWC